MKITKKAKKLFFIESGILGFIAIGSAVFDLSLNLGEFHGLVFSMYLLYFSVLVFFVNLGISVVNFIRKKKNKARRFIIIGTIVSVLGVGLSYAGNLF